MQGSDVSNEPFDKEKLPIWVVWVANHTNKWTNDWYDVRCFDLTPYRSYDVTNKHVGGKQGEPLKIRWKRFSKQVEFSQATLI